MLTENFPDEIAEYSFALPPELIAQEPAARREDARLLVIRREPSAGLPRFEDLNVRDLPQLVREDLRLKKNSTWLRNRSRVLPARFYARRASGGRHEIVLLKPLPEGKNLWSALVRNQANFRYPQKLMVEGSTVGVSSPRPGVVDLSEVSEALQTWLTKVGEMPLPPYIRKRENSRDFARYQSVWAEKERALSAAAPTASLHFSDELVNELEKSIKFADLFLHVGLGTFEPVRVKKLSEHQIHEEELEIPAETQALLKTCTFPSFTAIGTTALRAAESFYDLQNEAGEKSLLRASTGLFVKPGFRFRYVDSLLTNFHLPESTLFVLVSVFCGSLKLAQEAYAHAVQKKYRFFSYGDATLWL